jgi:hypothetical protein
VGSLLIDSMNGLTTLAGLEGITGVTGQLLVRSMTGLTSIAALSNLAGPCFNLTIRNLGISSLAPLAGITGVSNILSLSYLSITSLGGFAPVGSLNSLSILNNPNLTSLAGLSGLDPGLITIQNNGSLTTLGLSAASSAVDPFLVSSNGNLCQSAEVDALDAQVPGSCAGSGSTCSGNKSGC